LGDTRAKTKIRGAARGGKDRGPTVRKKRANKRNKTRRKTFREKKMEKSAMPHGVEGLRKVEGSQDGPAVGFRRMKTRGDRRGEKTNLVSARAVRTEARLRRREQRERFGKEGGPREDKALEETGKTRSERNGAVRRRRTRGFAGFKKRKNPARLPGRRKRVRRPDKIENMKEVRKSRGRKMLEHRKRNKIRTRGSGGGKFRESRGKFSKRERRTKRRRGGVRARAGRRVKGGIEVAVTRAVGFRNRAGKMRGEVRPEAGEEEEPEIAFMRRKVERGESEGEREEAVRCQAARLAALMAALAAACLRL